MPPTTTRLFSTLLYCVILLTSSALSVDAPAERGQDGETTVAPKALDEILPPRLDSVQAAFLRERAEAGDPAMQCLYGLALLNGSAGVTDVEEGAEWLRKSAEAGDERGGFEYGKMLYQGTHGEKDKSASLKWLLPAAERGMNEAAYYVGAALLVGENVEHDPKEAERWLRKAAESGLSFAQADIGKAYYSGIGDLEQDYAEARRWFILSAKNANGDSCNKLGVIYRNGFGVTRDPERAILWFAMGADLGDPYAQYNLGNSYLAGEWVKRDYAQAARLFQNAAARGNVDAQYVLGCMYADGIGVTKDLDLAQEWLVNAARTGHAKAEEVLEKLYELENSPEELTSPPAKVSAAGLLRESAVSPLQGVARGRVVLLELDDSVEISRSIDGHTLYLTLPGYPGVIHCVVADGILASSFEPETTIRAVGAGFSGLPGFIRFFEAREAQPEDFPSDAPAQEDAPEPEKGDVEERPTEINEEEEPGSAPAE